MSTTATFAYAYEVLEPEANKKLVIPHEELAPHPGVSCSPMKAGCRALKFKYATETTASGENKSEWGTYKDRLEKIYLEAYNPASKEMVKRPGIAVAEYSYDKQGRLRAEWDPRISPALKTMYGYDAEGHVTALTPPGQESWAFTYGAIAGDSGTGRLIKVTQASTSAGLWKGESEADTEVPAISGGTPVLGTSINASLGKWTGSPVVYNYQWERCNGAGGQCVPIAGATNADYTPTAADLGGHTLVVRVGATNGDGTLTAVSAATAEVVAAHKYSLETGSPRAVVAGPDGNLWFTSQVTNKVGRITTSGTEVKQYSLPSGSLPHGIATDPQKESRLWFTDYGTSKIGRISTSGTELKEYELPKESKPYAITPGPEGEAALWFTDEGTSKIGRITTGGEVKEYKLPEGSKPRGIVAGPNKEAALWFTEAGTHKIARISTSGQITEHSLTSYGAAEGPSTVTVGPDGQLWFSFCLTLCELVEPGKISTAGTVTVYSSDVLGGSQSTEGSVGITTGPDGNIWLTTMGGQVANISSSGVLQAHYGIGSEPMGITDGPANEAAVWLVDYSNNAIDRVATTAESQTGTPQPGTTIEYGVPIEGIPCSRSDGSQRNDAHARTG